METELQTLPAWRHRMRRFATATASAQGPAQRGYRILVVDDEEDIRESVEHLVPRLLPGAQVVTAASASEALDASRQAPFDLVMSDYRMPGTDGLTLLRELRREHPSLPLVLFTAYPDRRLADEARQLGVEFLPKPLGSRELTAALRKALGEA